MRQPREPGIGDKVRDTSVAAVSPDGLITATVGGRGELIGLELDARVFERGDARWLAGVIVTTADAAVEKARLS